MNSTKPISHQETDSARLFHSLSPYVTATYFVNSSVNSVGLVFSELTMTKIENALSLELLPKEVEIHSVHTIAMLSTKRLAGIGNTAG